MKIYVIMQKATQYNDEYDAVQEDGAKVYKAFRNKPTQEQIDAAKWDAIQGKTPGWDGAGGWPDDMAYVQEIEVDESQIVKHNEVEFPPKQKTKGTYAEAQARAAQARAEASKMAKDAFQESVKAIFDQYPDLEWFKWHQYTPYFNDGDECVFRVYSDYPQVKFKGLDEVNEGMPTVLYFRDGASDKVYMVNNDYSSGKVTFAYGRRGSSLVHGVKTESPNWNERHKVFDKVVSEKLREGYGDPVQDIKKLLSSIEQDDMKAIFGDHVEVTATRDGLEVESYDHD